MPTVQRRSTNRRRDRVREEEDIDATEDVDVDEDEEDVDDDGEEEYEDDDDQEDERRRPTSRSKNRGQTTRRRERAEEEDRDAETERPRRPVRKSRDGKSSRSMGRRGSKPLKAEGIHYGWSGAEETLKAGGNRDFLTPGKEIELIKFLEPEPLVSCRQHWVEVEGNNGQPMRRPHVCPGKDCPLCELGDQPGPMYAFNVLLLSGAQEPSVRILRLSTTGYQNLKEVSKDRKTGSQVIDRDYFAVQKTGAGTNSARVVFRPVKERDLDDDWSEIYDHFDPDELEDIISDAKDNLFSASDAATGTPRRELERLAKYLNDQED